MGDWYLKDLWEPIKHYYEMSMSPSFILKQMEDPEGNTTFFLTRPKKGIVKIELRKVKDAK